MSRVILSATSFDEVGSVAELNDQETPGAVRWAGGATSLVTGYDGNGQAVNGPSSLGWNDGADIYGVRKSGGIRVRWKLTSVGVTNSVVQLVTNQANAEFLVNSSNQLALAGLPGTATSSITVASGVWQVTEFWFAIDNANGAWRVVHNGLTISALTATSQDTLTTGSKVTGVLFNNANLVIDEVIIMGDTGIFAAAQGLEGPARTAKMKRLLITANGAYQDFDISAPNTGEQAWEDVDDLTNDGNTSKIAAGALNDKSTFLKEAFDGDAEEAALILAVLSDFTNSNILGNSTARTLLLKSGVDYLGSTAGAAGDVPSNTWIHRTELWLSEIETSVSWEDMEVAEAETAINLYEIGLKQTGSISFPTHCSLISLTVIYLSGSVRSSGIVLRGAYDSSGAMTRGYVCRLDYSPLGDIDAIVGRVTSGAILVDIATAIVTTGYGLAFDQNYELRASIENVGGTTPASGDPTITMLIDGVAINGWSPLITGIDINGEEVADETASAILSGSAQGLYLIPPASGAGFLYYSLWSDDFEPDPDDAPPEDEPTIPVGVECSGKVGTFAAPVGSTVGVDVSSRVAEHQYQSGHVARILLDTAQRRRWSVGLPAGMTTAETTALWTFWNAHGKSIPFDFADPETGTLVCAHFADDSLATIKQAPSAHAYAVVIEELLENSGSIAITPNPAGSLVGTSRGLRITTYAPRLNLAAPPTRALTITRYAPLLVSKIIPPTKSLTIANFAPKFTLVLTPGTKTLTIIRTAPTIVTT